MKSFVVIGMSRFGTAVARKLTELGHEVLAVDKLEHNIHNVTDMVTHAVIADATEEKNLKALGISNYDCAILAIGYDLADSVLVTLGLKELGVKEIICRARDIQHKKILQKIGADRVIIPESEAGVKLAVKIADLNLLEFTELDEVFGVSEMTLPARWAGKSIQQIAVRQKYACTVVAVKKPWEGGEIVVAPGPDYVFMEKDILVLIGETEGINLLSHL